MAAEGRPWRIPGSKKSDRGCKREQHESVLGEDSDVPQLQKGTTSGEEFFPCSDGFPQVCLPPRGVSIPLSHSRKLFGAN